MKRLLVIAALLLASSAAQAQYTFEYGGRTIHIDPDRGTVSIPGVYDNTGRRKRSHNDGDSDRAHGAWAFRSRICIRRIRVRGSGVDPGRCHLFLCVHLFSPSRIPVLEVMRTVRHGAFSDAPAHSFLIHESAQRRSERRAGSRWWRRAVRR